MTTHSHCLQRIPATAICCLALMFAASLSDAAPAKPTAKEPASDVNSKERIGGLARLPDWSGMWEPATGPGGNAAPKAGGANGSTAAASRPQQLPYNPTWTSTREPDNAVTQCVWGLPRLLDGAYTVEITVLPEQTFMAYDVGEYRHIWTDGRKHPKHVTATSTGHSVGQWEGETLLVHTVGLLSGIWVNNAGATLSDKADVTEHWNQLDKDHLKVDVTIDDPVALIKPYTSTRRYQRVTEINRQPQQNCFENTPSNGG